MELNGMRKERNNAVRREGRRCRLALPEASCIEEEKIKYNIDWVKCIMKLLNKKLKDKITINEICDEGFIDFVIQNNNIDQFIVNVCNYIKDNINDIKKKLLILDTLNNNPKEIICDDEIIKLSYEFIDEYKNIQ